MGKQRGGHAAAAQDINPDIAKYMSDDEEDQRERQREDSTPLAEIQQQESSKCVLLASVPIAPQDKLDKLREKLQAIIVAKIGEDAPQPIVYIPVDSAGASVGVALAYLDSQENAQLTVSQLDGFKFGKNVLRFYLYSQLQEEVPTLDALLQQQQQQPGKASDAPLDLSGWLLDGREQFALRFADETQIKLCDSLALEAEVEHVYGGERDKAQGKVWCRKNVQWSSKGTFLMTYHDQGLVLWGGAEFLKAGRFAHARMTHAEVSPCERFVVTYEELQHDTSSQRENLLVWSIKTQQVKRGWHVPYNSDGGSDNSTNSWPLLKWSFDGQYVARQIDNGIAVYDSSSMALLDNKPVACKGLASFEWSPQENSRVAYWSPEEGNVPARICVVDVLKRQEVRSKIVFSVQAVKLFWHAQGDFLCAQVTRTKKKTVFTSLELFRMRDQGVPNETINVNETVQSFAWEPSAGAVRFAVVHTPLPEQEVQQKMHVCFYSMGAARGGKEVALVHKLDNRPCNYVAFAPNLLGVALVCSLEQFQIGSGSGAIEFFDLDSKQTLAQVEHYNCSQVQWDPSGRFVASVCCQPYGGNVPVRYTVDNGYRVWSFQGQRLQDVAIHDFYQFVWRPRPKSVLTEDELEDVRRKLPNSMRKMDKDDALNRKRRNAALNAARIVELEAFRGVAGERAGAMQVKRANLGFAVAAHVGATGKSSYSAEDMDEIVERVEELLSEKTELYVPED